MRPNLLCPLYRHADFPEPEWRIDHLPKAQRSFIGGEQFLGEELAADATCFERISRELAEPEVFNWETIPEDAVVALSGGLDSFLISAMLKKRTGKFPKVATLVSKLPDYCEAETTRRLAEEMGMTELIEIEVNEENFIAALPEAIKAAEVPLYNLHPVSKWLFAKGLRERGITRCVTGDGADQLSRHETGCDYLPVVGSLYAAAEVTLLCPLYSAELRPPAPDTEKLALREMAQNILPEELIKQRKKSCFTPAMNLSRYLKTPTEWSEVKRTHAVTEFLLKSSHG